MASKYDGVIERLPRLLSSEPHFQEKVEKCKAVLRDEPDYDPSASALAVRYSEHRAIKAELTSQLEELNIRVEAFTQILIDRMEAENLTSLKLTPIVVPGIGMLKPSITVQTEPYAQVVDKDANRRWAIANGMENRLSLPWQTVNEITKARLLAGEAEPDGVTCYMKKKLFLLKG